MGRESPVMSTLRNRYMHELAYDITYAAVPSAAPSEVAASEIASENDPSVLDLGVLESAADTDGALVTFNNAPLARLELSMYLVNGGLDSKYSTELPSGLRGLMAQAEFETFVDETNERLKRYRHKKIDKLLLASGTAMLPLIPYALRANKRSRKNRKVLQDMSKVFEERFGHRGLAARVDRDQCQL